VTSPLSDVVAQQYERWRYPAPIEDLEVWAQSYWEWFDPWHAHRVLWPDRRYKPGMDILIAGCGTNQAAVFAHANPRANVVAVDISDASLEHQRHLKTKYGLENLELHRLPIERVHTLDGDFDLIVSTGVLHHLADPITGIQALADCLRPDGVMALMVYATYGRIGVDIMQSVYRDVGLHQDEPSLRIVKESLVFAARSHPVRSYLNLADDVASDAGLVDTFLHGRARCYTVDDCLELVKAGGLVFQDWFLKSGYYPPRLINPNSEFLDAVEALPQEKQWSVMERLNTTNGCHFFLACRADRPTESYRIDFSSAAAADYIPSLRWRCDLRGTTLSRWGWSVELNTTQLALAQQVDGRRTIDEIAYRVAQSGVLSPDEAAEVDATARTFFKNVWQTDFVAITLPGANQTGNAPQDLTPTSS
jgi:SAM-dependent methyltransferase